MEIIRFYDEALAHASYLMIDKSIAMAVDPARNPKPYLDKLAEKNASLKYIVETHPHADFVSSHLELHKITGATILTSKLTGALYPHTPFDDGETILMEDLTLEAINTPGHSPDSICVLVKDKSGDQKALFTGDTVFIGDVGRPDLRESAGNIKKAKELLAIDMFQTLQNKIMKLNHEVTIYPAHGNGSLCGKALSDQPSDSLANQIKTNYAFGINSQDEFVSTLLAEQPFVPKYFPHCVEINKRGADNYLESISKVVKLNDINDLNENVLIIDARNADLYKAGHLTNSYNLQDGEKFETWLGSIVNPGENYYLLAENQEKIDFLVSRAAKIGYENQIKGTLAVNDIAGNTIGNLDFDAFEQNKENFTIVDVRNTSEFAEYKVFDSAINIPLHSIRERIGELSNNKPIVVHCKAGYRSAAGSSIIKSLLGHNTKVYDYGEKIADKIN